MDKEKALIVVKSETEGTSRLKVVNLDDLDLDVRQLFILKMGARDDVN